jgi:hypothetical protein
MPAEMVNEECLNYATEQMLAGETWSAIMDDIEIRYDADPTWSNTYVQPIVYARYLEALKDSPVGEHAELVALRALVTPVFTAYYPVATGDTAGGELRYIFGTGFVPGLTVSIGGHLQTIVSVRPTQIVIRTVAHAAAAALDTVITNPSTLAVTDSGGFEFAKVTPVFTSIYPVTGKAAGGTICNIIGTDFTPGMTVAIGGHACTVLSQTGTTGLCIRTPAHAAGALNVVITAKNTDADTDVGGFTYV